MNQETLNKEFSTMILSVSGLRKIFAQSHDEEDTASLISDEDKLICVAVAKSVFDSLNLDKNSKVLLARDARPTGSQICSIIASVLSFFKVKVSYAGICSAPEIMAQSTYDSYSCFIYVSASHNPIGHNGIKIGNNGGVFNSVSATPIIENLKNQILDFNHLNELYESTCHIQVTEDKNLKEKCLLNYLDFVKKTTCPDGSFDSFTKLISESKIGIVADLNGSARCLSIDKTLLNELGVKTCFINDTAGRIAHGIVPEGKNLEDCCRLLEEKHKEDASFVLGYVPDNDGDRGNLVYTDNLGKAHILKAQDVFALCVSATLEYHTSIGVDNLAVAVNCATSMRIDELAKRYNARVFRAEVGEANAVELAAHLRSQGYNVPILGEGSNGGNITHPAKVRDPMNTLMCMFRLLQKTDIQTALKNIEPYLTTDSFSEDAKLHLNTKDYPTLKKIYEENFVCQWEQNKEELAKHSIVSYLEFQTEGITERQEAGKGNKGGLRMVFYNKENNAVASIWMRPSGTEPLFRIQADVKGNDSQFHDFLINWQRNMILAAQNQM